MFGQIEGVAPDGRVGRAGHGLRPGVAGQQSRLLPIRHSRRGISPPEKPPHPRRNCHHGRRAEPTVHHLRHPHSAGPAAMRVTGHATGPPRPKQYPNARHPPRTYAMTRNARIKSVVRDVKYRVQEAEGRAQQAAGKATGNDNLAAKPRARNSKADSTSSQVRSRTPSAADRDGGPAQGT